MKPIEEVLFRSSGSGALMVKKQGAVITETQLKRIDELLYEKLNGVNAAGNKVKWTDNKIAELEGLETKRDAPPELSDTAKAFVRKVWLQNEKGIVSDIKSKYLDKGTFNEEEAITLISEVDGVMYSKNDERRYNDDHSGECDVFKDLVTKKVVHDVKCSWNAETFMSATPDVNYEWQGRIYMELWDADEFHLRYCLVDCPPHLLQKEKDNAKYKYYSGDMTDAELDLLEKSMEPIYEQIERNLVYSNNPAFNKEERVKTFIFYRDKVKMAEMKEAVKLAREYYKIITLNGKN
jgi:hypothetical protein